MVADLAFARLIVRATGNLAFELLFNSVVRTVEGHPGIELAFFANAQATLKVYGRLLDRMESRDAERARATAARLLHRLDTSTISALTASFLSGVTNNPDVPSSLSSKASVELAGGVPFVSDKDLQAALDQADVPPATADAIIEENTDARIEGLRTSLSLMAIVALIGMFFTRKIPDHQPGTEPTAEPASGAP